MSAILLIPAAAGIAALLGLVPGALSVIGTVTVGVLGLGALAALLFRGRVRAGGPRPTSRVDTLQDAGLAESATRADRILRIPRFLFYLGALTIAQSSLRPVLGLSVSELFFIAAFGATVVAVLAGRPSSRVPNALVLGACLFAVGGLISSLDAASPDRSGIEVTQGIYVMLLWVWTGATVLRTRAHILAAMTLWTISAAVDGFAAITQVAGMDAIAGPLEGTRATGFTDHPNDLGGACAIALVPALLLATSQIRGHRSALDSIMRPASWLILALIAAGLVLSASVGAMIAGFMAVVVWLIAPAVRAPGRLAVVTAVAFTILAVMFAGGRVTSPLERVDQVTSTSGTQPTSGSGATRIETMERGLDRIAEQPIVGTGLDPAGAIVTVINRGSSSPELIHGQPVAIWYQAGILGLLGVLIVVATLARTAWRSLIAAAPTDLVIGLAIFAAFVASLIHALGTPFYFHQYAWYAGLLIVAWSYRRDAVAQVVIPRDRELLPRPSMAAPRPLPH